MTDVPRLEINRYELDKECEGQSTQRGVWGEKHADALLEVDEAKSALAVVMAEVDRAIREEDIHINGKKITDTAIASMVLISLECKEAVKRLNEAKHAGRIVEASVEGLEHRKTMLVKMVDLHGRDYFAEPRASEDSKEAVERVNKRVARSKGVKRD